MGLFWNNKSVPVVETSYQDVVDYLRDLNQQDYNKILKVVNIYRDADKGVKKVLNIKENTVEPDDFLSDNDTELGNFLEDEPPKKSKTKAKKGEN